MPWEASLEVNYHSNHPEWLGKTPANSRATGLNFTIDKSAPISRTVESNLIPGVTRGISPYLYAAIAASPTTFVDTDTQEFYTAAMQDLYSSLSPRAGRNPAYPRNLVMRYEYAIRSIVAYGSHLYKCLTVAYNQRDYNAKLQQAILSQYFTDYSDMANSAEYLANIRDLLRTTWAKVRTSLFVKGDWVASTFQRYGTLFSSDAEAITPVYYGFHPTLQVLYYPGDTEYTIVNVFYSDKTTFLANVKNFEKMVNELISKVAPYTTLVEDLRRVYGSDDPEWLTGMLENMSKLCPDVVVKVDPYMLRQFTNLNTVTFSVAGHYRNNGNDSAYQAKRSVPSQMVDGNTGCAYWISKWDSSSLSYGADQTFIDHLKNSLIEFLKDNAVTPLVSAFGCKLDDNLEVLSTSRLTNSYTVSTEGSFVVLKPDSVELDQVINASIAYIAQEPIQSGDNGPVTGHRVRVIDHYFTNFVFVGTESDFATAEGVLDAITPQMGVSQFPYAPGVVIANDAQAYVPSLLPILTTAVLWQFGTVASVSPINLSAMHAACVSSLFKMQRVDVKVQDNYTGRRDKQHREGNGNRGKNKDKEKQDEKKSDSSTDK